MLRLRRLGQQPTTISGTIFAPNGTLPLYGVSVYVPNKDPRPFTPAVQCGSCSAGLSVEPIAQATTDENGQFSILLHWHNIRLEGSTQPPTTGAKPAVWPGIASFVDNHVDIGNRTIDTIDEVNNPQGTSFASWMLNVTQATLRDQVPIINGTGKHTAVMVDNAKAERWVYWQSGQNQFPQNFQFTTPNEVAADQRCGRVAFSDMHVSGGPIRPNAYPTACGAATTLSAQEKALAFMFFDISSCVK